MKQNRYRDRKRRVMMKIMRDWKIE